MKTESPIGGVETIMIVVIGIVKLEEIAGEHVMIHITAVIHTYITMVAMFIVCEFIGKHCEHSELQTQIKKLILHSLDNNVRW